MATYTGISLKGFAPILANYIGLTPLAVYERQRALVRCGLLPDAKGRGPGSGVRATPEAVALLLIAVLATDNLSEIDNRVVELAGARADSKTCPLTGAPNLAKALAIVLSSEGIAAKVSGVVVNRATLSAQLRLRRKLDGAEFSGFGRRTATPRHHLEIEARLSGSLVAEIAGDLPILATVKTHSGG